MRRIYRVEPANPFNRTGSLDIGLNEVLVEPDRNNEDDWNHIILDGYLETGFFSTLDYVLKRTKEKVRLNLLAVAVEPEHDCAFINLDNFNFIGYDLLDQYYCTSALANCGGFDETFLPADLNNLGLIEDYKKAYEIKEKLYQNNPYEEHADTNVIAVWRHQVIGH
ncbi:hypothetical protein [Chitinophaga polysaccharea]|uniref:hypothetical protein n=1 Tax=Chitinophaga polysaccharea TaxID=1293035 RepID=UPI001C8E42B9|nr:hypothetical protein [Chitinophaga polysaccharea]